MKTEFSLGEWRIRFSEGTITSGEKTKRVEPKALSVLVALAEANGQVVSRDMLLDKVWPNQVVGDDVINSSIATLRKALGDNRKTDRYIQTVPKKGYKIVKDIQWHEPQTTSQKPPISPSVKKSSAGIGKVLGVFIFLAIIIVYIVTIKTESSKDSSSEVLSIAVLPFETFSSDPDIGYFANGLAEEMLHQLVTNPKLKVMSRSASFKYQNSEKNLQTIAEELNVKYIIGGSVREHNKEYRITVQLIDAQNNFHLWSRVFDDSSGELFKIQQQVSIAVSDMLNINPSSQSIISSRRHPESEQAYKYFVMAQSYMKVNNFEEAQKLYEKAIDLSSNYALAYVGKAAGYLLRYQYNHIDKDKAILKAKIALDKASEIEPNLAEAYATKGLMFTYLKEYREAEKYYLKALELHPNLRLAHHNFSFMLWQESRFEQAVKHGEIALATDPLAGNTLFIIGDSLASLAEFDKAIAHYTHCHKVLPQSVGCIAGLANLYQLMGEMDLAQSAINESASIASATNFWHNNTYASFLIHRGSFKAATELLKQSTEQNAANYFLLRTSWLAALARDEMDDYIASINQLSVQRPDDMDVKKFQALNAYWQQDFELAIKLYEEAVIDSPMFMFNIWDYSDGLSHANILAKSYDKTNQQSKKQKLLLRIEHHIDSYPNQLQDVPGGLYIKAQYYSLVDNKKQSEKILEQLKQTWTLKWLPNKDPFWTR